MSKPSLAYDVETTCVNAVQVIEEALAQDDEISALVRAALRHVRADLLKLQARAVSEQRAAVA